MNARELIEDEEDPICCIGMVGDFPGTGGDLDIYWSNLAKARVSVSTFAGEELIDEGVRAALVDHEQFVAAKGVVSRYEQFDAEFFNMSARDALVLDPQQRVFLTSAWRLLEQIAYVPEQYDGRFGIFAGVDANTYLINNYLPNTDLFESTGLIQNMMNDKEYLTTRIAYHLNFKGPAITVQTACSTSLVAIHQAAESLLRFECDMAFAGGVSLSFPMKNGYVAESGGILATDGFCRAFDERSSGTVYGSGHGIVALKRLSSALEDGDHIYGKILGSAVNNDGAQRAGFTTPSVAGQTSVMSEALGVAGIDPGDVGYIETHGTGTALGDSIEYSAICKAYGLKHPGHTARYLGSVKPNIGHLSTAAGVASFIKAMLMFQHQKIPPLANYTAPNTQLNFQDSDFAFTQKCIDWESSKSSRTAGINSFGLGGTNCHVLVREPDAHESIELDKANNASDEIVCLSAKSRAALNICAQQWALELKNRQVGGMGNVAYTSALGRDEHTHRAYFLGHDYQSILSKLGLGIEGSDRYQEAQKAETRLIMLVGGQSIQNLAPMLALCDHWPRCADRFGDYSVVFRLVTQTSLPTSGTDITGEAIDIIREPALAPSIAYPLTVLIQCTLLDALSELNVQACSVVANGIGEFVAAYHANVMSLHDALFLAHQQGVIEEHHAEAGLSITINASIDRVTPYLDDALRVSAIDSHESVTVHGNSESISGLKKLLKRDAVTVIDTAKCLVIPTSRIGAAVSAFQSQLDSIEFSPNEHPYVSSLTGDWVRPSQLRDRAFWSKQFTQPALFSEALTTALRESSHRCVDISAYGDLSTGIVNDEHTKKAVPCISRIVTGQNIDILERASEGLVSRVNKLVGELWVQGQPIKWAAFYHGRGRHRVRLPGYPLDEKRYFLDVKTGSAGALLPSEASGSNLPADQSRLAPRPEQIDVPYREPCTAIEHTLVSIFGYALGIKGIGINDSFFSLGGNSLVAISVLFEVEKTYGIEVPVIEMMEHPTIEHLASYIDTINWHSDISTTSTDGESLERHIFEI